MTPILALLSATAQAEAPAPPAGSNMLNWIIPYAAIFALFYFLFIRPGQKQKQAHEARIRAVKRGDEIVTAGGVIGEVVHIKEGMKDGTPVSTLDDRITIKSADARIVIERRAIIRLLTPVGAEEEKPK